LSRKVKIEEGPSACPRGIKLIRETKNNQLNNNKSKEVVPVTPRKSKEYVKKNTKNLRLQAKFSPSRRGGPACVTGLFIKFNYQTTFLCKNNPGYWSQMYAHVKHE